MKSRSADADVRANGLEIELASNTQCCDDGGETHSSSVILEIAQGQVASGRDLEGDALASTTLVADDRVAVARCDGRNGDIDACRSGSVGVGGALSSWAGELLEVETTSSRKSERRGDEILLLREEEDNSAGLASIARWNVEVEDGRHGAGELAVV